MKTLTPLNTRRAIERNLQAPVKCRARYAADDLFIVRCPNGHDHHVRVVALPNGEFKAECDCSARRSDVCHHETAALALFHAMQ